MENNNNNKKKIIFAAAVLVFIIVGIIITIYLVRKYSNKTHITPIPGPTPVPTPTPTPGPGPGPGPGPSPTPVPGPTPTPTPTPGPGPGPTPTPGPTPVPGPTPSPSPQPNFGIINYGDIIQLQNQWGSKNLLSACNPGGDCSYYNATLRTDNIEPSSQQWQIYSLTKYNGSPILYGDTIKIKNQYSSKQDLGACGNTTDGCGVNVVVGRMNPDLPSETWIIEGKTTGTQVTSGDIITLRNNYNSLLLSSCGYFNAGQSCGVNASLRTDYNNVDVTQQWKIGCVSGICQ